VSAALALALCLLLSSCYETEEAFAYLSIRSKARSLEKALADPSTKPDERLLIEESRAAREFARSALGLKETKSYASIVELDADRLATVVQACAELSFDRHLWSYPFVGKLPYRGYFDPKDAEKEASRLKKLGFDVIARPVDAFSTLGFLADPLFSFMSSYDEAAVVDLVVHEMTHATVFLKGSGGRSASGASPGDGPEQFNEELATFVGREGSLIYLARKYGPDSAQVRAARDSRSDAEAFASYLAGTAKELEAVYSSKASEEEKRSRKAEVIAARAAEYKRDYPSLFKGKAYEAFPMERINNAYIDLYRLYEGESSLYRDFYERACGSDLKRFVETVSRIARDPKLKAGPKAEMRRELAAAADAGKGK
jgi:predicted aminopeptidase